MKKIKGAAILCALLAGLSLAACSGQPASSESQSSSGISSEEASSESASPAEPESGSEEAPLLLESPELGFSVELPALLKDHIQVENSQREAYGETISTVSVYYTNGESEAHVLSFEEMSQAVWEQVQAEGGPLGTVLGESDSGRVVILNTLQSNPFAEGTEDYELFNQLPRQFSVIYDTFQFTEA